MTGIDMYIDKLWHGQDWRDHKVAKCLSKQPGITFGDLRNALKSPTALAELLGRPDIRVNFYMGFKTEFL